MFNLLNIYGIIIAIFSHETGDIMIKQQDKQFYDSFLTKITTESSNTAQYHSVQKTVPTPEELEQFKLKCRLAGELYDDKQNLLDLNKQINALKNLKKWQTRILLSADTIFTILYGYLFFRYFKYFFILESLVYMIRQIPIIILIIIKVFLDADLSISRNVSKRIGYTSIPMKLDNLDAEIRRVAKRAFEKQRYQDTIQVADFLDYK